VCVLSSIACKRNIKSYFLLVLLSLRLRLQVGSIIACLASLPHTQSIFISSSLCSLPKRSLTLNSFLTYLTLPGASVARALTRGGSNGARSGGGQSGSNGSGG
jgi:hypothetical protein